METQRHCKRSTANSSLKVEDSILLRGFLCLMQDTDDPSQTDQHLAIIRSYSLCMLSPEEAVSFGSAGLRTGLLTYLRPGCLTRFMASPPADGGCHAAHGGAPGAHHKLTTSASSLAASSTRRRCGWMGTSSATKATAPAWERTVPQPHVWSETCR